MAPDGGCERNVIHGMNEGYSAWGALKSVLRIKAKQCKYEGVIVQRRCTEQRPGV